MKTAESLKNILCRGQPGCATCAKPVKGCRGVGVTPDLDEKKLERAYEKIVVAAVVILVILVINRSTEGEGGMDGPLGDGSIHIFIPPIHSRFGQVVSRGSYICPGYPGSSSCTRLAQVH